MEPFQQLITHKVAVEDHGRVVVILFQDGFHIVEITQIALLVQMGILFSMYLDVWDVAFIQGERIRLI